MADGGEQDTLTEGRPASDEAQSYGDPEDTAANLLTLPDKKAAAYNYRQWRIQPKEPQQRRRAEWQVNVWRREGRSNVFAQKVQDKGIWQAWEPPWEQSPIPVLNKADRLCRRLKNISFADPPVPEAIPSTGEEEDIEAARLGERILMDIQSEANLDDIRTASRAFDRASSYGSGFVRYYIDERGGGRQPVRIMAKKGAVSANTPFLGPDGEELPGELVARYVTEAGELQDTAAGAATRWVPGLRREILAPPSIRFLPHDAEDIWDADGIIIGTMPTWGELEALWPEEMKAISKEDKEALFAFKPEHAQDLRGLDSPSKREHTPENDRLKRVAVFTTYHKAGPLYPEGCYFIGLGDRVKLHRQKWTHQPEGADPVKLEIPVTQYMQFDAGRPDPYGLGLMHLLGNGHELRASQVAHLLQYLDQFANRRTFLPTNSIIQPKQLQLMAGATIPMNPGGKPEFEEIPAFPAAPMDLFALITAEMDDHSMLQQTAQGTDESHITSGRQQAQVVQTAMASLSEIRQNIERAYLRGCRIEAQQIQMGYTVPQQISWTGEDGQYRQQWWSGSDLRGTADFKLKQGSLSMMTPEQKMNLAVQFKEMGVYEQNPDLFYEAITSSMGPVVGLVDDPSRVRIKRQLATWSMGPPAGWMERVQAEAAQATGQPGMVPPIEGLITADPMAPPAAGMQAPLTEPGAEPTTPPPAGPPEPPPQDPALAAIFELVEADEIQDVAVVRLSELKRFMASTRFTRWPPEWRAGVVQEFQHMKLCAGVQTIPEQQQAATDAQAAEQEAASVTAEQEFQHQLQLEQLKIAGHQNGNGREPGGVDLEIQRDPTGRMARLKSVPKPAEPAVPAGAP